MLIFLRHRLAFLAVPKTGTTAIEQALAPSAEIVFSRDRKHITARRYKRKIAPFLEDTFGVRPEPVAVMREPLAQLRSWYRYRSEARLDGHPNSTAGISFDKFVREVMSNDPPPRAQIGSQFQFLTGGKGKVLVNHLFSYEAMDQCVAFMAERLGEEIELRPRNVSPKMETPLAPDTFEQLQQVRAADFALYDAVMTMGGYLRS